MTKKILITTESLVMGGVETSLLSLLKFLGQYDVDIDLYVTKEGILSEEAKKITNVNIIPVNIPKNDFLFRIKKNLLCRSLYRKYKKINTKEYDIAIAYYGINNYSDMYAASSNSHKKYIWVHNNFEMASKISKYGFMIKIKDLIVKSKFKFFDKIIAVSNSSKDGFINTFKGFDEKVLVINNIFDISKLDKKDEKCEYKLIGKNKLIYVGRLVDTKSVDKLILECQKVFEKVPDTYLYIVGDGPDREKLQEMVRDLKLDNKIKFLGNQINPYKYMNQADVVVTASVLESYGITIFEALAMKKYFVSAINDGSKEIFDTVNNGNKNNGVICEQNAIGDNIINYLENKDKFRLKFNVEDNNKLIQNKLIELFQLEEK